MNATMVRKGSGLSPSRTIPVKPPDERYFCRKAKQPVFTITTHEEAPNVYVPQERNMVHDNYEMDNLKSYSKNKALKEFLPVRRKFPVRIKTNSAQNNVTSANVVKTANRSRRDGENMAAINKSESSANLNDVWSVIRNMNRTQFRNSPLLSDEDLTKKKVIKKRRYVNNRRDKQLPGCCTEEFAFISTITDVEGGFTPSHRPIDNTIKIIDPTELDYRYNVDTCRSNLDPVKEIRNEIERPSFKFTTNANPRKINNYEPERKNRLITTVKKCDAKALTNQKRAQRVQMVDNNVTYYESYQENSTVLYNSNTRNGQSMKVDSQRMNKGVENSSQHNNSVNIVKPTSQEVTKTNHIKFNAERYRRINPMRPNLTQAEITRRLSKIRFPIIILGKDEVNNKGKFLVKDFTQFDGLEQHMWPYMTLWTSTNSTSNSNCSTAMKNGSYMDDTSNVCEQVDVETKSELESTKRKSARCSKYNRKYTRNRQIAREKSKTVHVKKSSSSNNKSNTSMVKVTKSIKKMERKVTSKYSLPHHVDNSRNIETSTREKIKVKSKIPLKANEQNVTKPYHFLSSFTRMGRHRTESLEEVHRKNSQKARQASKVIETVIRNVQNGSYYIDDNVKTIADSNVIATQTCTEEQNKEENLIITSNVIEAITANDMNLKDLQINTLNANQIEVNISSQKISIIFDVVILSKINTLSQDVSNRFNYRLLDAEVNEMNKFKYEHCIMNEVLPAQLCTIVPKLFLDIKKSLNLRPVALPLVKISDLDIAKSEMTLLPVRKIQGNFTQTHLTWPEKYKPKREIVESSHLHKVLTPLMVKKVITFYTNLHLPYIMLIATFNTFEDLNPSRYGSSFELKHELVDCQCKHIQLYDQFNYKHTMEKMLRHLSSDCFSVSTDMKTTLLPVSEQINNDQIILSVGLMSPQTNEIISVTFDRRESSDPNSVIQIKEELAEKSKSLTIVSNSYTIGCIKTEATNQIALRKHAVKRKHYIKLYRKCKSTINITREKSATKIDKIRSADDFYDALGPGNLLSNVVDNTMAMKIIDSLKEMRAWISEITPRQALLVMLLLNKKDTPNLTQFRHLILQAIAVNRITMSNELDMEIEVIEKEKLLPVSQKKAIANKNTSGDKADTLLEELYFIAKTTASDYEKPFDETSEKLLKSLLEKRKKLNPSYLRVMARYVGLGLLKAPKK